MSRRVPAATTIGCQPPSECLRVRPSAVSEAVAVAAGANSDGRTHVTAATTPTISSAVASPGSRQRTGRRTGLLAANSARPTRVAVAYGSGVFDASAAEEVVFAPLCVELIRIRNFRGLAACSVEFESELTVLVGRNNAGKSRWSCGHSGSRSAG